MSKKLLMILFILFTTLILTVPYTLANNVGNDIKNGASSLVNDARSGVGYVENTIEGAVKDAGNAVSGNGNSSETKKTGDSLKTQSTDGFLRNDDYTATRTATSGSNTLTTNNMFWTWIILAIAAVIIVSLVWYYGNQRDNRID